MEKVTGQRGHSAPPVVCLGKSGTHRPDLAERSWCGERRASEGPTALGARGRPQHALNSPASRALWPLGVSAPASLSSSLQFSPLPQNFGAEILTFSVKVALGSEEEDKVKFDGEEQLLRVFPRRPMR